MNRRTIILGFILSFISIGLSAADYDRWTTYPVFSDGYKKIIDTGEGVFYCNGSLFSYNPQEQEQQAYTKDNGMLQNIVENIFFNKYKKYILATHANGGIDLVYTDGRIRNISDIVDAELPNPKINDVAFDEKHIYLATAFGIVKLNGETGEVIESGLWNKNITAVTPMADKLLILADGYIHTIDKDKSIRNFSNFTRAFALPSSVELKAIDDETLLSRGPSNNNEALRLLKYDVAANQLINNKVITNRAPQYIITTPSDEVYVVNQGKLMGFNDEKELVNLLDIPADYQSDTFGATDGLKSLWCINTQGITNISVPTDGGSTQVLVDRFCYPASFTRRVFFIEPTTYNDDELILSDLSYTMLRESSSERFAPSTVSRFKIGSDKFISASPYPVEANGSVVKNYQNTMGKYILGTSAAPTAADEPGIVYILTNTDGIFKVDTETCEVVGTFTKENMPITGGWGIDTLYGFIDNDGNLWVITWDNLVYVLTADKRRLPTDEVTIDDWQTINLDNFNGAFDAMMYHSKRTGLIYINGRMSSSYSMFVVYDNNGTPYDFSDDTFYPVDRLVDQDGKEYDWIEVADYEEDNNGRLWLGTAQGVFVINDPRKMPENRRQMVNHVKVPRNDGTNEADYLLGDETSYIISTDSQNRKWIAASTAGLLLVSASGNEILQEFNSLNSPLPESIKSVWVDKRDNSVYVGTTEGMFRYDASETGVSDDYSNIYAYPNPVRPEYLGSITIKGLMDNSLVKIADASGNVVAQGRSENGEFKWNGLTHSGSRAKSGVYYVFASQNTNGTSAAVTKILVVN